MIASLLRLPRRVWRTGKVFHRRHGTSFAAALAYRALFSFAPLIVIVVAIAGVALGQAAAEASVLAYVADAWGPDVAALAGEFVAALRRPGYGAAATTVAGVIVLYGASRLLAEFRRALNGLWSVDVPDHRRGFVGWLVNNGLAIAFVLGGGLLMGASLALSALIGALAQMVLPSMFVDTTHQLATEAVFFAAALFYFAIIYRLLPAQAPAWRDLWQGAAVTAVLFTVGKLAVALYVRAAGIASAYGAAGTVAALLAWVHFTAVAVLFGATLTHVLSEERSAEAATRRGENPADDRGAGGNPDASATVRL